MFWVFNFIRIFGLVLVWENMLFNLLWCRVWLIVLLLFLVKKEGMCLFNLKFKKLNNLDVKIWLICFLDEFFGRFFVKVFIRVWLFVVLFIYC